MLRMSSVGEQEAEVGKLLYRLLQKGGVMASNTVSHEDYSGKKGERYEAVKPRDSDILRGDGSFISQTQNRMEFTPKKGDRFDTVKQGSADIWRVIDEPS